MWIIMKCTLLLSLIAVLLLWRVHGPSFNASLEFSVINKAQAPVPPVFSNDVENVLEQLRLNGTSACHHMRTQNTRVLGLPEGVNRGADIVYMLHTNVPFTFMLLSVAANGSARCSGGDYYETELTGDRWRSRPGVIDYGNGSYSVTLLVDDEFAGLYNFTAHLLFDNFHGLDEHPESWVLMRRTVKLQFHVISASGTPKLELPVCKSEDMRRGRWRGRWTRGWYNETCEADEQGRYKCLSEQHESCEGRWCSGRVANLESNGWVYSEKCAFHIWEREEAWRCLNGKWLFLWGDSNMPDMLRNLLLFVLGISPPHWANITNWNVDRAVENFYINPVQLDQAFHVSLVFNGHYRTYENGLGLDSLLNKTYQTWLLHHFNGSTVPDFFILNSGLHDGLRFATVDDFISALDYAAQFWDTVFKSIPPHKLPSIILRTAVAPAGEYRGAKSNPHKMEVFNALMVDRLKILGNFYVLDTFDPTFPFHFDYSCSDGGHYGRPPRYNVWPWHGNPHQYFVEIMLVHMMLNVICNK